MRHETLRETIENEEGMNRREFLKKTANAFLAAYFSNNIKICENILNAFVNGERTEDEPKISVEILFLEHETSKDIEKLEKKLEHTDIYITEMYGWTEKMPLIYNEVSRGEKQPKQALVELSCDETKTPYDFFLQELRLLYQSNKNVEFIDVPKKSEIYKKFSREEPLPSEFPCGDFDAAIKNFNRKAIREAAFESEREQYMLTQLEPLSNRLRKDPRFKRKKDLQFLLSLGGGHTKAYHELKKKDESVKREFSHLPYIYGFYEELIRRHLFSKKIDGVLVARAFLEDNFPPEYELEINKLTLDTHKTAQLKKSMVKKFSLQEINNIFTESVSEYEKRKNGAEGFSKGEIMILDGNELKGENEQRKFFCDAFKKTLKQKGIKTPKTERELDEIIQWKET